MKNRTIWLGTCLLAALALPVTPEPVAAQLAVFDTGNPRASFRAMGEYLARDGGRWRAANPNHDGSERSPPEFGLWFTQLLNGRVLQIQIVVHYADRTVVSSHGQWAWHPGADELRYVTTDRGGAVTEGVTTFPDSATFMTVATRVAANGSESVHRDDNVLISDSVHRNETFQVENGQATSGGVYEWRREGR